jgi:hypothetical protein
MYLIETKNRGDKMHEIFTKKVRTAAVARWWTLLIVYCILLIQWLAYVLIHEQAAGRITLRWGEGVTWPEIRAIWLWAMVAYKLGVGMIVVSWLTLWAR